MRLRKEVQNLWGYVKEHKEEIQKLRSKCEAQEETIVDLLNCNTDIRKEIGMPHHENWVNWWRDSLAGLAGDISILKHKTLHGRIKNLADENRMLRDYLGVEIVRTPETTTIQKKKASKGNGKRMD